MLRYNKNIAVVVALFVFPLFCIAGVAITEIHRDVEIEKSSPIVFAGHLSCLFGIPVCVEQDLPLLFECKKTDVSLENVLETFATIYPAYSWIYDDTNKLVNIFPQPGMGEQVMFEIQNATNEILEVILEHKELNLRERGIAIDYIPEGSKSRVILSPGQYTLRQLLNSLCAQLSWCSHWTLKKAMPGATFWEDARRPILLNVCFCSYPRPVKMTAAFLGVEPVQDSDSIKFNVSVQMKDRKAFYELQMGYETGGVSVVEYNKEKNLIIFQHGDCKLELIRGKNRSYELVDFAVIKKWLSWPNMVTIKDEAQANIQFQLREQSEEMESIKSLLLTQIDQYPAGSQKRIVLEAELRRLEQESIGGE